MNYINQYKNLPRPVYLLSFIRAVVAMGMMFVYPFLSLFLTSVFNYDHVEASYIVLAASAVSTIGSLLGGRLSDAFGRKKVYISSALLIIAGMIPAGFLTEYKVSLLFIICAYFGVSLVLPTISAMILDHADESNKTECFSLMYLSGNVGNALGPVVAGALFYDHLPWIFFCMAIAFSVTFFIMFFGVKDIYVPKKHIISDCKYNDASHEISEFRVLISNPALMFFVVCLVILTLCYINLDFMLPLQFSDFFGLDKGSKYSSLIWTVNGAIVIFATPFIVGLTKKCSPLFNIGIAAFLYAAGFGIYGITHSAPVFMITVAVWTSGEILISTCAGIYIADESPETHKGRSMSLYEFARSLGKLIGPVAAGRLLINRSYSQAWLIISIICLITGVSVWILYYISHCIKNRK